MNEDEWIQSRGLISPERAHAVGLVVLYSNMVEDGLRSLLTHYSGMDVNDAAHFTYPMDPSRLNSVLRSLIEYKETDPEALDHIKHGLLMADLCRKNRNIIAHSWTNFGGDKLFKQSGAGKPLTAVYDFDLTVIRRVADEMWECGYYLMFLGLFVGSRGIPMMRQSLPKKPALPQSMESIDQYGTELPAHPPSTSPG